MSSDGHFKGYYDVDLDGTLAEYHGWNWGEIGPPVPKMVERVKNWMRNGQDVRIFTARVAVVPGFSSESGAAATMEFAKEQEKRIERWCMEHIGWILPITAQKDFNTLEIWDDRARRVEFNTGELL